MRITSPHTQTPRPLLDAPPKWLPGIDVIKLLINMNFFFMELEYVIDLIIIFFAKELVLAAFFFLCFVGTVWWAVMVILFLMPLIPC